jgi:hypothetical protein
MRQTYYLHNGAYFNHQRLHNTMAGQQGIWPISHDAPVEGHDATTLPLQVKLDSAELLLEMSQIPVVTQESQNGKYFHNRI